MSNKSFSFIFIKEKVSVHVSDISKLLAMPFLPPACFTMAKEGMLWTWTALSQKQSVWNNKHTVLIHQNAFKAGPKPINSTELETYRCQQMWIQLPTSEIKAMSDYTCAVPFFQKKSAATWQTYWTLFPNKNLAHNIRKLPARPLPVFHSRHYSSVPWEFLPPGCISQGALQQVCRHV